MATDRHLATAEDLSIIRSDKIIEAVLEAQLNYPNYPSERRLSPARSEVEEVIDNIQSQIAEATREVWYSLPGGLVISGTERNSYKDGELGTKHVAISLDEFLPEVQSPVRLKYHFRMTYDSLFREDQYVLSVDDSCNSCNLQAEIPLSISRVSFTYKKPRTFLWIDKSASLSYRKPSPSENPPIDGRTWDNLLKHAALLRVVEESDRMLALRQSTA